MAYLTISLQAIIDDYNYPHDHMFKQSYSLCWLPLNFLMLKKVRHYILKDIGQYILGEQTAAREDRTVE